MSIFDPFDPERPLSESGCVCGHHRSKAEHDHAARMTLQCAPPDGRPTGADKRYEGVVAAAALRAAFRRPPRA
jgi:nitrate/nitrite transport system substrate-binding protein